MWRMNGFGTLILMAYSPLKKLTRLIFNFEAIEESSLYDVT